MTRIDVQRTSTHRAPSISETGRTYSFAPAGTGKNDHYNDRHYDQFREVIGQIEAECTSDAGDDVLIDGKWYLLGKVEEAKERVILYDSTGDKRVMPLLEVEEKGDGR